MKCPQCKTLNKRASSGTQCTKCGYRFVFSPKTDQMTDGKFQALLQKVSQNGKLFFTEPQLYATLAPTPLIGAVLGILVLAGITALILSNVIDAWTLFWLPLLCVITAFALFSAYRKASSPLSNLRNKLQKNLKAWQRSNGPLKNLLVQPTLLEPPPQWREADIYAYGAERLLIVERMILVDWLVKNNLHTQTRTLILSEHGYPDYLLPVARKLLAQRPDLPVFLLHDASPTHNMPMARRVRQKNLFALDRHPVVDIGLNDAEIQRSALLRKLRQQDAKTPLPVDLLPYAQLSVGLAAALASGVALAAVMAPPPGDSGSTGGAETDFG